MSPLLIYTVRSLTKRPLNSLFVAGSIALVAFTISSLAGLAIGLDKLFDTNESQSLVLVIANGVQYEEESHIPIEEVGRLTADPSVKRYSVEALLGPSLPPPPGERLKDYLVIRGVDEGGFDMHGVRVTSGRMPAPDAEELLVGESLHRHYPQLQIGSKLPVYGRYLFTIVGMARTGTVLDDNLWTWRSTVSRGENEENRSRCNVLYLDAGTPAGAATLIEHIKTQKGLKLTAQVAPAWRRANASRAFGRLYYWLSVLMVLVAAGALLAVSGVFTLLFLRRTGDISVLRAMGFRLPSIAGIVLVEIELVAAFGSAIGLFLAGLLTRNLALQAAGPGVGVNFTPSIPPWLITGTLGLMILFGAMSSLWPIYRLSRMDVRTGLH